MSDFVPLPRLSNRATTPAPGRWNNRRGRGVNRGRRGGGRHRGGPARRSTQQWAQSQLRTRPVEEFGCAASENSLCVAVEGCCHGELDAIYDTLMSHQNRTGKKVDLLLCCGDFQSLRSTVDYHSLAVPAKYRSLGSFHRYYSGEKKAPILTIFIGGNHEASQPLQELTYGGWVAKNIYYLGTAGVVRFSGLRIAGISGIFKNHDYQIGRFERPPYNPSTIRSVYHVRSADVFRLKSLSVDDRLDIVMSHDWPQGIEMFGNTGDLIRRKPYFQEEIERNDLGSPPNFELLTTLQPKWWFSAHLHVKFFATILHGADEPDTEVSTDAMAKEAKNMNGAAKELSATTKKPRISSTVGDMPGSIKATPMCVPIKSTNAAARKTHFLALDKCLPRRDFLSIVHLPTNEREGRPFKLEYDIEWLAILKKTHNLTVAAKTKVNVPDELVRATEDEKQWVRNRLLLRTKAALGSSGETGFDQTIPENFFPTVPAQNDMLFSTMPQPFERMGNPQTDDILDLLQLEHVVTVPYARYPSTEAPAPAYDDSEIDLLAKEKPASDVKNQSQLKISNAVQIKDEDEISLDEDLSFQGSCSDGQNA